MASNQKIPLTSGNVAGAGPALGEAVNLLPKARNLVGEIIVTAIDGGTTLTGKIQHSADKVHWYDYMNFTVVPHILTSELKFPTNASVLPYVRSSVALAGGALTATVAINLFFEPN